MIYAINMKGWEEYEPHWFICDCSKKEFKKVVLSSIEEALDNLMSDEMAKRTWIDGHALLSFLLL